LKAQF